MAEALLRLRAEALAGRLPPLLVAAERVAATVAQGVHGRRRVGTGDAFWQFRPYSPGDPVGRIDWRETAKGQRAYIRENEWEAAQSVWLWADGSPSMDWRSGRQLVTKADRAGLLLLALAALLIRGGERAGVLGSGVAPNVGRAQLERMAATLVLQPAAGLPANQLLPRHGGLVLIGDFFAPLEDWRRVLGGFAASGVRGHLLQVLDPAEETLPFEGRVRFDGVENEGSILIGRVDTVRARYADRLAAHRQGLADLAHGHGWSFGVHHTDQPPHAALLALYGQMAGSLGTGSPGVRSPGVRSSGR